MADDASRQPHHVLFSFACLAQKSGRISLARNAWQKYVDTRPEDPRGHHNLGVCLEALKQDPATALACFSRAFALEPAMGEAAANGAGLLMRSGEAERAISLCYSFRKIQGQPDAVACSYICKIATHGGLGRTWIPKEALKQNPQCSAALYNLNTALRMAGRQGEAVAFSWQWILKRLPSTGIRASSYHTCAALCTAAAEAATAADTSRRRNPSSVPAVASVCTPYTAAISTDESDRNKGSNSKTTTTTNNNDNDNNNTETSGCTGSIDRVTVSVAAVIEEPKPFDAATTTTRRAAGAAGATVDAPRDDAPGGTCNHEVDLTVVCVRWGDKYGVEYVERLAKGVSRNLRKWRHGFVCFTDDVESLRSIEGVEPRLLGQRCREWSGWWNKAFLFSREAGLTGRVLYIDLDTVISGRLDDIAAYSGPFAALSVAGMSNECRSAGINSSIMSWDAAEDGQSMTVGAIYELLHDMYTTVTACIHKFDHWLEMTVSDTVYLQREFPAQIVEYAAGCCYPLRQQGADLVQSGPAKQFWLGHAPLHSGPVHGTVGISSRGLERKGDYPPTNVSTRKDDERNGAGVGEALTRTVPKNGPYENAHEKVPRDNFPFRVVRENVPERVPRENVPENARIVCFPLEPKPHDVDAHWVRRFWLGVE